MIVESLSLKNYRNYENLSLDFSDGTNILEAVYMSGTTKSHRTSKDLELIRFSEEESHISTMVRKNGISHKIDIHLKNNMEHNHHGHTHDHSSAEETIALLKYMAHHNSHHAEELSETASALSEEAAILIKEAVELLNKSTEKINQATSIEEK